MMTSTMFSASKSSAAGSAGVVVDSAGSWRPGSSPKPCRAVSSHSATWRALSTISTIRWKSTHAFSISYAAPAPNSTGPITVSPVAAPASTSSAATTA